MTAGLDQLAPGVPASAIFVIALAVLVGALVQTVAGLGVGLLGAPVVGLVAPELVPSLPLFFGLGVSALALASERAHVDWWVVWWTVPARIPGTALGVWLVVIFTPVQLGVALAVVVLLAVLLTMRTLEVPQTRATLVGAAFVSGVTGSATSIGGPPIAMVLQHRPPAEARSTMSVFFLVGTVLSLVGLALTDHLPRSSVVLGAVMLVPLVAGFLLGARVRHRLPRERFRHAVLVVCAFSALGLLARSLL